MNSTCVKAYRACECVGEKLGNNSERVGHPLQGPQDPYLKGKSHESWYDEIRI